MGTWVAGSLALVLIIRLVFRAVRFVAGAAGPAGLVSSGPDAAPAVRRSARAAATKRWPPRWRPT